jgi:putative colanic acid biosynthesis UDP-glucose lipid carrier transferase
MILERHHGAVAIHALLQGVAVFGGFAAWYAVVDLLIGKQLVGGFGGYSLYGGISVAALMLRATYRAGSDALQLSGLFRGRLNLAGRQTLFVGLVVTVFLVATKDKEISRVFLFSWFPVLYATLALTNLAMPHLVLRMVFSKNQRQRFLLVTSQARPENSERLGEWLRRQQRMGISISGLVSPSDAELSGVEVTKLGIPEELEAVFEDQKPDVLMSLEAPKARRDLARMLNLAEGRGARLIFWDDLESRFGARAWNAEVDGLNFVHFRREPLESPLNRAIKRLFDLIVAGVAVFFVMPWLAALVWTVQRFQSPGPVLFRQARAGLGGQEFQIFKFRTMHAGGERDTRQATQADDRIYPFARWLRKTSLDEIPQFLNVLKGEMSVVGPRPHLSEHNSRWERLLGAYNVRAIVKPGVTGLAQVRGMRGEAKTDEDVIRRIESDLEYIENYTPMVDFVIVIQTAWQIVFPNKTAY